LPNYLQAHRTLKAVFIGPKSNFRSYHYSGDLIPEIQTAWAQNPSPRADFAAKTINLDIKWWLRPEITFLSPFTVL
jgi:hypothetical protein